MIPRWGEVVLKRGYNYAADYCQDREINSANVVLYLCDTFCVTSLLLEFRKKMADKRTMSVMLDL